jgi:alpha-tubulin suppressor-like RCC1 family protein
LVATTSDVSQVVQASLQGSYWIVHATGSATLIPEGGQTPPAYQTTLAGVKAIAPVGTKGAVILMQNGTVWTEGEGTYGQLGDGTQGAGRFASTPVQVSGLTNITQIAGGTFSAYALRSDGTVWAWGAESVGALGNGVNTVSETSPTPVQVPGLTGVTAIAADTGTTVYAIKSDGTLWVWGCGALGGHADGTTDEVPDLAPTPVPGVSGISQIQTTLWGTVFAFNQAGEAWAWGNDNQNLTGTGIPGVAWGDTTLTTSPQHIPGVSGAVAGGGDMILRSDGRVYVWSMARAPELAAAPTDGSTLDGAYLFADTPAPQ